MILQPRRIVAAKVLLVILATGIVIGTACSSDPKSGQPTTSAQPQINDQNAPQKSDDASETASGKELFAMNCMLCHKETGKGGPVSVGGKQRNADDLTSQKMKDKTDEKLMAYVRDGVVDEGMPSFKDKLTEEEIKIVVGYVRELQGK